MKIACVLALLLSCSVLATVHGSRIQDILSKIKGSGRRNGYDFVEDRGCSSTSSKRPGLYARRVVGLHTVICETCLLLCSSHAAACSTNHRNGTNPPGTAAVLLLATCPFTDLLPSTH
jgi:hypothetical protein